MSVLTGPATRPASPANPPGPPKLSPDGLRRAQAETLRASRFRYSFPARLLFWMVDVIYGRQRTLRKRPASTHTAATTAGSSRRPSATAAAGSAGLAGQVPGAAPAPPGSAGETARCLAGRGSPRLARRSARLASAAGAPGSARRNARTSACPCWTRR